MTSDEGRGASVAVLQTIVPDYRVALFEELRLRTGASITIAAGQDYFTRISTAESATAVIDLPLKNRYFLDKRLAYQSGVGRLFGKDVLIAEFNPRILSTWLLLLARRLTRRRTFLWGHDESRQQSALGGHLRSLMTCSASGVITYTETGAARLRSQHPRIRVIAAPNALYRQGDMRPVAASLEAIDFACIGRFIAEKRQALVLDAFLQALPDLPPSTKLHFIGSGPTVEAVREAATGHTDRVLFHGHMSDAVGVARVLSRCAFSVSGGYIGLSAVQSIGFGVPIIYPDDEPHAPEFECLTPANSVPYHARNAAHLSKVLIDAHALRWGFQSRAAEISAGCAQTYSIEATASALGRVLEGDSAGRFLTRVRRPPSD